jgi:hypothetical protein
MKPTNTQKSNLSAKAIEAFEDRLNHMKEIVHQNGTTLEHLTYRPISKTKLKKVYQFASKHILLERFIEELTSKLVQFKNEMNINRQMKKFSGLKSLSQTFGDLTTELELVQEMQFNVTKSYFQFINNQQKQPATTHLSMVA